MSMDFSFDKRTTIFLAGCIVVACLLIFVAGILLGVGHRPSGGATSFAAIKNEQPVQRPMAAISKPEVGESAPTATTAISNGRAVSTIGGIQAGHRKEVPVSEGRVYCLQFGSFQKKAHAENLIKTLKKKKIPAELFLMRGDNRKEWFVVRAGKYSSIDEAAAQSAEVIRTADVPALVRRSGTL